MSQIKLSVIVPVYNAEIFLKKCIESILQQSETNIEVILVDDGSVDNSLQICKEYAQKDNRVYVLHQQNAGVSVARNQGICLAQGKYIGFVDSDDWIEPRMYERLLEVAEKQQAEVVMCDVTTVYSNGVTEQDTIIRLNEEVILKKENITPMVLLEMAGSTCRCIYKREMIVNRKINFPVGVKFSEDRIFNIYAMGYANKISYLKEAYYMRFVNMESAVYSFHEDYYERVKIAAKHTKIALEQAWDNEESYQKAYLQQFIGGAIAAINNYFCKTSSLNWKEKWTYVKRLCEDEELKSAICETRAGGIRGRWIVQKNIGTLIFCTKVLSWLKGR